QSRRVTSGGAWPADSAVDQGRAAGGIAMGRPPGAHPVGQRTGPAAVRRALATDRGVRGGKDSRALRGDGYGSRRAPGGTAGGGRKPAGGGRKPAGGGRKPAGAGRKPAGGGGVGSGGSRPDAGGGHASGRAGGGGRGPAGGAPSGAGAPRDWAGGAGDRRGRR